jgi:C1A family cysteine protease
VAFAAIATLDVQVAINSKLPWFKPSFSPQDLFACGNGACDYGWWPSSAASHLKRTGVVDASCAPYLSGITGRDEQCSETCPNYQERLVKIDDFDNQGGINEVIAALQNGPLITSMTVYEDFLTYKSGIYRHAKGEAVGGHAISLIGYNQSERYWIIRNSWGKTWGEEGFARISWEDSSGIGRSTISLDLKDSKKHLQFMSPVNDSFISGVFDWKVNTNLAINSEIKFSVTKKENTNLILKNYLCQLRDQNNCEFSMNTSELADGAYVLTATSGDVKSYSNFYISNSPDTNLNWSIAGDDVDLTAPLKGRIEMTLKIDYKDTPPVKIALNIINKTTGEVEVREYSPVLKEMKIGLRTNVFANGTYTLKWVAFFQTNVGFETSERSFDVKFRN